VIALYPPAIEQCVAPTSQQAQQADTLIVLDGDPKAIAQMLVERPYGSVIASDQVIEGRRKTTVKLERRTPYKTIGSFVYLAQGNHLNASFRTEPAICGMEEE
jgi:hypothetical protein